MSFLHALVVFTLIFLGIFCIGLVLIIIILTFIYSKKVNDHIFHKSLEDQSKRVLGPFKDTSEMNRYLLLHEVNPSQIAIVNIGGTAKAFKINNDSEVEEVHVDWDEIDYMLRMQKARGE